jgi:hypothetical protein
MKKLRLRNRITSSNYKFIRTIFPSASSGLNNTPVSEIIAPTSDPLNNSILLFSFLYVSLLIAESPGSQSQSPTQSRAWARATSRSRLVKVKRNMRRVTHCLVGRDSPRPALQRASAARPYGRRPRQKRCAAAPARTFTRATPLRGHQLCDRERERGFFTMRPVQAAKLWFCFCCSCASLGVSHRRACLAPGRNVDLLARHARRCVICELLVILCVIRSS